MPSTTQHSPHYQPRVVIIGAGFAGLTLAKRLRGRPFEVLLLDQNNYHTFIPLLYQVATGGLEASSVAYPVRRVFRGAGNVRFQMAEVRHLDTDDKLLQTSIGPLTYDYLVIATGSVNNFFNFTPVKEALLTLKSVPDALTIRAQLMANLEKALATYDADRRETLMNVAIVGGGPSGIEMAGTLAEMRAHVLPRDFPGIDFSHMHLHLFEALPRLLSGMSDSAGENSLRYLRELGVEVHLNAMVERYDPPELYLSNGEQVRADSVIWTAGVKGNLMEGLHETFVGPANRIVVDEYNQVEGLHGVFALGDVAAHVTEEQPKGMPMLAPVAIQQAKLLAKNLVRTARGKSWEAFSYHDKGVMAIIGRRRAVADLPFMKLRGGLAWLAWLFVHLISLVGFRNKIITLIDWMNNYIRYDRPLGLIIRREEKAKVREEA